MKNIEFSTVSYEKSVKHQIDVSMDILPKNTTSILYPQPQPQPQLTSVQDVLLLDQSVQERTHSPSLSAVFNSSITRQDDGLLLNPLIQEQTHSPPLHVITNDSTTTYSISNKITGT